MPIGSAPPIRSLPAEVDRICRCECARVSAPLRGNQRVARYVSHSAMLAAGTRHDKEGESAERTDRDVLIRRLVI
jgi:hypothetical protein